MPDPSSRTTPIPLPPGTMGGVIQGGNSALPRRIVQTTFYGARPAPPDGYHYDLLFGHLTSNFLGSRASSSTGEGTYTFAAISRDITGHITSDQSSSVQYQDGRPVASINASSGLITVVAPQWLADP